MILGNELGTPSTTPLSVDEIVDEELEAEKLLWKLFEAERPHSDVKMPLIRVDDDRPHEIVVESLPPTVAPASPSFAVEEPAILQPDELNEVVEVRSGGMEGEAMSPRRQNLIKRLSMLRDERRQHERDRTEPGDGWRFFLPHGAVDSRCDSLSVGLMM